MKRIILYNKDVQLLTGKSEKASYRLMVKIKQAIGKERCLPLTLYEFCDYVRLRPDQIRELLR